MREMLRKAADMDAENADNQAKGETVEKREDHVNLKYVNTIH